MATPRTPSRRLRPLRTGVLACLVAVGWVSAASASPGYPGQIMDYLEKQPEKGLPACPPTCLLCHSSPYGGAASVRPEGFVETLKVAGEATMTMVGEEAPIEKALTFLETSPCPSPASPTPCDTDNDGTPDIAEIRLGTDPNGTGELSDCPKYGCGASSVTPGRVATRHLDGTLSIGALGLLAFLVRRRRSTAA